MTISPTQELIDELRRGRMIVLADAEDRENEGDLVLAAEKTTPEAINFMVREGRGLVCLALTGARCDALELPPMVEQNTSNFGTAFTVDKVGDPDGNSYAVNLNANGTGTCECKGFYRWNHCRHAPQPPVLDAPGGGG